MVVTEQTFSYSTRVGNNITLMASKKPSEKKLWKSKTFWVGAALMASGFLAEFSAFLAGLPEGAGWALVFSGAIQIALRVITKEAVKIF